MGVRENVFTDRGTIADAARPVTKGEYYEKAGQEKARHDRFYGSVVGTWRLSSLVLRHTPEVT